MPRGHGMNEFYINTPLVVSDALSRTVGVPVYLKMDALQPTGSFKLRGMSVACQNAVNNGARHLVASSGGNAGYAVAYIGRRLGVEVTVVVPETTSPEMREKIASEGATIMVHGRVWAQAHAYAQCLAYDTEAALIHPYDNPLLWQGHSTLVDEVVPLMPKPALVILAVGGGGLLCGVVEGMHRHGWQDVPVLAVETEGSDKLSASLAAGRLIRRDAACTVATSLATDRITRRAWEWAHQHPVWPCVVSDAQAIEACLRFADDQRVLVEPSCGAALASAYFRLGNMSSLGPERPILIIVCGGIGVSRARLREWEEQLIHTNSCTLAAD